MNTPETLIARLEALISTWRGRTRRSDGKPGEGKGPISEAVRQCASELESELRDAAHALSGATPATSEQVEANAILEAVETVASGGKVSDFMESFGIVRAVMDLREGWLSRQLANAKRDVEEMPTWMKQNRDVSPTAPEQEKLLNVERWVLSTHLTDTQIVDGIRGVLWPVELGSSAPEGISGGE